MFTNLLSVDCVLSQGTTESRKCRPLSLAWRTPLCKAKHVGIGTRGGREQAQGDIFVQDLGQQLGVRGGACGGVPQESLAKAARMSAKGEDSSSVSESWGLEGSEES